MIERLLQIRLRPIARAFRRQRTLITLMRGWLAAAGIGLFLILLNRAGGWSSPWLFLLLSAATVAWTFFTWFRSLRVPLDLETVARKIEAENPVLHARLLTAVEQIPDGATNELNYLQDRVIREALSEDRRSAWRKRAAKQLRLTQLGSTASLALLALVFLALYRVDSPRKVLLAMMGRDVTVTPGDANVEKGSSLVVLAKFEGDVPSEATLVVRPANEPEQRVPLKKNLDDPVFGTSLPDIQSELTYCVEYGSERTADFRVTVFEFPRLERADARINYPDYTGLPEKNIEDTRRISAVEGSAVEYTFYLNKPVKSAKLAPRVRRGNEADDASTGPNSPPSASAELQRDKHAGSYSLIVDTNRPNVYVSNFKLEQSGRFELVLVDDAGRTNKLPPLFVLDALTNRIPDLKFAFPKGDQRVSALEEIGFKAEVSDDFGLKAFGLAHNLAGQETKFIELGKAAGPNEKRQFERLVPMEDLEAQPDQLLSYYLWAEDVGPDGNTRRTAGDMFFAEVRPFEEIFREGQPQDPNAQQQQQRGQQNDAERLAELQKQIISATWNLQRRETGESPSPGFKSDAQTVKDSQENALQQVDARMERLEDAHSRALLDTVHKEMEKAVKHLTDAADDNAPKALPPALSAEQTAYQALLRLAAREFQIAQGQRGQGGGGGGGGRAQRQLDQLELRQSRNRYETERQAAPPLDSQQREQLQAFNRLKELAQRQQDVNERLKELQAALQAARTEAEREELRQRLKRLQEEQQQMLADVDELRQRMDRPENQSQMADARQQLDQTRDEVQRASEAMDRGEVAQALSSGTRAQRDLQQLREEFRSRSSSQFAEDMRELRGQARELAQNQEQIGQKLDNLNDSSQRKSLTDSDERKELASQLDEQKQRLEEVVKHATEITQKAEPVEPLLSQQLYETLRKAEQDEARNLRDTTDDLLAQGRLNRGLYEQLTTARSESKKAVEVAANLLRDGFPAEANTLEQRARQSINDLKSGVERAAESVLGDDTEALRFAQAELEELGRQLEREIAQAERSRRRGETENPNSASTNLPPELASSEQQAQIQPQRGQSQQGDESQQGGQGQESNQPGEQAQSGQSGQGGEGQAQPQELASATQQGGGDGRQAGQDRGDQPGGQRQDGGQRGGNNLLDQIGGDDGGAFAGGPITGPGYAQWSDRLRDVEELLDVPELRAEAARIRDRVRLTRVDLKRHSREPQWDLVNMQIAGPLVELRNRISEELARRESREAVVPIDRDPVPTRYSELVRRYYERLGKSEAAAPEKAGSSKR